VVQDVEVVVVKDVALVVKTDVVVLDVEAVVKTDVVQDVVADV
jgi:hypothetical protein